MGVTIHYRGRINNLSQVPALSEELTTIASAMGWESTSLDDDWEIPPDARLDVGPEAAEITGNLGLKGVQITPGPGAESLSFFFDREGNLRSPMTMILLLDGTLKPENAWISVKTQFTSPEIHVWIVGLLKYLKKRYITNLEVSDEGEYWETGDIRILKAKMDLINEKIDYISSQLSSGRLGDLAGLSAEEIASRIEQMFDIDPRDDKQTDPDDPLDTCI